jgi:hypothetical protein
MESSDGISTPIKRFKHEISPNDVTCLSSGTPIKSVTHQESTSPSSYSRMNSDFCIIDIIGTGTFGTVYRAKGVCDNVTYAIKKSRSQFKGAADKSMMMHEVNTRN